MKNTMLSLLLVLLVSACSHKTESNVTDIPQAKAAAQKSAEQWLALIDAGNYAESWKTAAGFFQAAVPQDQWGHTIAAVREPLGDLVSRQLKSAQYSEFLPDAPAGNYVVLQFNTSFANKNAAVETITPKLDPDGQWKVSGYYIK
jgi:hypothetical protein